MRWLLIILLMCNGIFFVWQGYLVEQQDQVESREAAGQPEHKNKLELLAELPEEQAIDTGPEKEALESKSQVQEVCLMIGPFKELISSKQVAGRMASLDIELKVVELAMQGDPDYWVHIPPLATRKLALKKLRELQAKKVDSFLVTEGELANGISLGFFTSKSRADAVYEKRKEQGYEPQIKVVPRTYTEIWLVSSQLEGEKISDLLWETIKEGNSDLERRKNYCNTIASIEKLE